MGKKWDILTEKRGGARKAGFPESSIMLRPMGFYHIYTLQARGCRCCSPIVTCLPETCPSLLVIDGPVLVCTEGGNDSDVGITALFAYLVIPVNPDNVSYIDLSFVAAVSNGRVVNILFSGGCFLGSGHSSGWHD